MQSISPVITCNRKSGESAVSKSFVAPGLGSLVPTRATWSDSTELSRTGRRCRRGYGRDQLFLRPRTMQSSTP